MQQMPGNRALSKVFHCCQPSRYGRSPRRPQTVETGASPAIFNPKNLTLVPAEGELEEELRQRVAFSSLRDAE